jgi:hypothetical protein
MERACSPVGTTGGRKKWPHFWGHHKEARWRVESGMATQRAGPRIGTAIERLRKQRVKVIWCQRPLLLPLYKALAQPKQRVYDNSGADAFKPLICICLVVVYEGGEAERRRPRGAMKCRILHIRCKPGVCKPGVGGRASGLRRVAAPSDQPERAENRCRREKRRRKPGK